MSTQMELEEDRDSSNKSRSKSSSSKRATSTMPAKREQIALQEEISNQEQWDDLMVKENMIVVDVYQKWCGPCLAVISLFRRLKNEIGDDLLKFAVAECDSIEALEKYRGRCEPCFLFFAGGQLVDVVRGARGPVLNKAIVNQLAAEHRVQDEGAERKAIKDPMLAALEEKDQEEANADAEEQRKAEEKARTEELHLTGDACTVRPVGNQMVADMFGQGGGSQEPVPKEVTIVLIKPDAVKEEKVDEIKQKILESGFEILAEEEKTLTEDEAKEFYKEQEGEEHFEALVQFMSGGPSRVMVLTKGDTGEGVVHEVRALIGPKDIDVAKEEAPDSLRAQYGTDKTMNAMHGADSGERAARELSFFFPEFVAPIVPGTGPPPKIQKTLALIRPDALKDHKDDIIAKIQESGFEVALQKEVQLTEDQAKEFYKEQEGTPHFEDLIREMTAGPVLALGLAKEEAVQGWRNMLGPKEIEAAKTEAPDSLRALYSTGGSINALHGSDNPENAEKELNYFFPVQHTLAVIKPDAVEEHKDVIIERIKEAGFNIAIQKEYEMPKDLASQLYKEHEGKEFYDNLVDYMSSGPSMVMVLSREDAVDSWRTIMGPTDPELAKEQAPESLRALLGKDVLQNAIHGSSNPESAKEKIAAIFPEVDIKEDGKLIVNGEEGEEQTQEGEAAPAEGEAEKTEEQAAEGEAAMEPDIGDVDTQVGQILDKSQPENKNGDANDDDDDDDAGYSQDDYEDDEDEDDEEEEESDEGGDENSSDQDHASDENESDEEKQNIKIEVKKRKKKVIQPDTKSITSRASVKSSQSRMSQKSTRSDISKTGQDDNRSIRGSRSDVKKEKAIKISGGSGDKLNTSRQSVRSTGSRISVKSKGDSSSIKNVDVKKSSTLKQNKKGVDTTSVGSRNSRQSLGSRDSRPASRQSIASKDGKVVRGADDRGSISSRASQRSTNSRDPRAAVVTSRLSQRSVRSRDEKISPAKKVGISKNVEGKGSVGSLRGKIDGKRRDKKGDEANASKKGKEGEGKGEEEDNDSDEEGSSEDDNDEDGTAESGEENDEETEEEKSVEASQDEGSHSDNDADGTKGSGKEDSEDGDKDADTNEAEEDAKDDTKDDTESAESEQEEDNKKSDQINDDEESDNEKDNKESDKENYSSDDNNNDTADENDEAKEETPAAEGEEKTEDKPAEDATDGEAKAEGETEKPAEGGEEQKQEEAAKPVGDETKAEEGEAKAEEAKPEEGQAESKPEGDDANANNNESKDEGEQKTEQVEQKAEGETKVEEPAKVEEETKPEEAKPEGDDTKTEETKEEIKPEGGEETKEEAKPEGGEETKQEEVKAEGGEEAKTEGGEEAKTEGGEEAKTESGEEAKTEETKPAEEEKKEEEASPKEGEEKKEETPAE